MQALVTGGGGFLGRYVVEQLLEQGDDVTVFARGHYPDLGQAGAKLIRGDLQDADAVTTACAGQDIVYHVAAQPGVWGRWEDFYGANVIGTKHIIQACQQQGVPRLVFTSSPSVIFDNCAHENVNEDYPYPQKYENFYSQTKAISEQMVVAANSAQLLTVSLRPHLIWGPRDTNLLPRIIERAKAKQLIQVGDGKNKVDITYVEDAARAHLLAAKALQIGSKVAGKVYFISQDEPVVLWPWLEEFLGRLDLPSVQRTLPLSRARLIGGLMEIAYSLLRLPGEPRLTRFMASELAKSHYYDISRAKADFGYAPQYSIAEATAKTVAFLKR